MTVKEKIDQLRAELHQHNYNYYVLNAPEISDKEFDDLMRELQDLEKEHPEYQDDNSPTMRVGSDLNKNFTQVAHKYPMLSLGNTYSENEVTDFYERVKKALNEDFEICCELKYDGTSISLTYEDGKLVRAVTRGDGEKGDDVTDNVKTIRTIPLVLHGNYPKSFEIRGEILMPWVVFEELNRDDSRYRVEYHWITIVLGCNILDLENMIFVVVVTDPYFNPFVGCARPIFIVGERIIDHLAK